MAMRIGVGGEFFDRLREDDCYYVDKTAVTQLTEEVMAFKLE